MILWDRVTQIAEDTKKILCLSDNYGSVDLVVIIIEGTPKSVQSSPKSLTDWKRSVAFAASSVFGSPLRGKNLSVRITFYHNRIPTFDTDNVSKPIVDALKGIAYADDNQVMDRTARRRALSGSYRIKGVAPKLAVALAKGDDFVCVEVVTLTKKEVERLR